MPGSICLHGYDLLASAPYPIQAILGSNIVDFFSNPSQKAGKEGIDRQHNFSTHTQCTCREASLAHRARSGEGLRGQLTVSARALSSTLSVLRLRPFWIMGIASVESTPAFSLSSRDFFDSKEEGKGTTRFWPRSSTFLPFLLH